VWFRVQGSGFRVQGSGFRVQGSGFRVPAFVNTSAGEAGFRIMRKTLNSYLQAEASSLMAKQTLK